MSNTIKKIWNAVTTVLVALVVLVAIALGGVRLIGLTPYTVLSGSMEPTYHVGSLIYVKKVDYTQLQPGDVITFMISEDTLATHRIVEVVPDETDPWVLRYRTQGDSNEAADGGLVHYKNIVGTPIFTIPKMGYFASWVQNPPGTYIAITVGVVLLILLFLPDLLRMADESDKKAAAKKQAKEDSEPAAK